MTIKEYLSFPPDAEGKIVGGSTMKGMNTKMKKILAAILIILPVFVTGCFSFTKVSYTGNSMNNANAKKSGIGNKTEFKIVYGKVSYTDKDRANTDSQNSQTRENNKEKTGEGDLVVKNKFASLYEFDAYIQDIKKQSDWAMKVTESQEYTKVEINKAFIKNNSIIDKIKKIDIPKNIIKTSQGNYYANRYAKVEMESLVLLRSELLDYLGKNIGKDSKTLKEKINSLREGAIPIKEYAVKVSRQNMMDEEGYVWDEASGRFIPKNNND
jgi:uncharacterized protein YxeA